MRMRTFRIVLILACLTALSSPAMAGKWVERQEVAATAPASSERAVKQISHQKIAFALRSHSADIMSDVQL